MKCSPGTDVREASPEIRIAIQPLHVRDQFGRQKIVSCDVNVVASPQQDVIYAPFGAVIELQFDLVPHGPGRMHKAACADLDRGEARRKPSGARGTDRPFANLVLQALAERGP